jgi:hypothetical protein
MNSKFVNNDLPNINSDAQMQDYIGNSYKKLGVSPGQSSVADDLIATNTNTYYNKSKGYSFVPKLADAASIAVNLFPAGRAAKVISKIT